MPDANGLSPSVKLPAETKCEILLQVAARRITQASPESRTKFYKMMNARGWKTNEPGIEAIALERPGLPTHIGKALRDRGFTDQQAAEIAGFADPSENPFRPDTNRLRVV